MSACCPLCGDDTSTAHLSECHDTSELAAQVMSEHNRTAEILAALDARELKITGLTAERNAAQFLHGMATAELAAARTEVAQLKDGQKALTDLANATRVERDEARERVKVLIAHQDTLAYTTRQTQQDLDKTRAELKETQANWVAQTGLLTEKEGRLRRLQGEVLACREQLDRANAKALEMFGRLGAERDEAREQVVHLTGAVERLEQDGNDAARRYNALAKETEPLRNGILGFDPQDWQIDVAGGRVWLSHITCGKSIRICNVDPLHHLYRLAREHECPPPDSGAGAAMNDRIHDDAGGTQ